MIDVNLLPEQKLIARQDLKVKTYAIIAVVVLSAITLAIFFGMIGVKTYQTGEIARLLQQKVDLNSQITTLTPLATDLLTLKKKAKGISEIEKNKYDFKDAYGYISALLPSGINMDKLTINNSGNVVLSLASGDANEVVAYLSKVTNEASLKESKLTIATVDEEGSVNFTLDSNYGTKTKNSGHN